VSRKNAPAAVPTAQSDIADTALISPAEIARREGITKGIVLTACARLGITPRRTATGREHVSFNETRQIVEHIRRAPSA
jgi:hypothetical protein